MLEDATLGGARAVNQARFVGSLEVGKKADLLVVDTLRAHLVAGEGGGPHSYPGPATATLTSFG